MTVADVLRMTADRATFIVGLVLLLPPELAGVVILALAIRSVIIKYVENNSAPADNEPRP